MRRAALCLALLLPALLLSGPAFAKDVCVHTTARGGWTFVLKKLSLKAGASGAVSGHAVSSIFTSPRVFSPISGGYLVGGARLVLGITVYEGVQHHAASVGLDDLTTFHQIYLDLGEGGLGADESWSREAMGTIMEDFGDVTLVECASLPAIP